MIHHVTGDLLANAHGAEALAHGVNCLGLMGAGVAKELRARYPAMFRAYRAKCLGGMALGQVFVWGSKPDPIIFNLATQERVGRGVQASALAIGAALASTRRILNASGIASLAMPRIGCGLGGLSWLVVEPLVVEAFGDWPGQVYVHTLPGEGN